MKIGSLQLRSVYTVLLFVLTLAVFSSALAGKKPQLEFWLLDQQQIKVWPTAIHGQGHKVDPKGVAFIELYALKERFPNEPPDSALSLDEVFNSAKAESGSYFLGSALKLGVRDSKSGKWFLLLLPGRVGENDGEIFLVCRCDAAHNKILAQSSEFRESSDRNVLQIVERVLILRRKRASDGRGGDPSPDQAPQSMRNS